KELKSRPDDYFANKGKIVKAEILTNRATKSDFVRAEKLLTEVVKMSLPYTGLIARAKLDLADIVNHPKAVQLLKQVHEMVGLDPYLIEKASIITQAIKEKARPVNHVKKPKPAKKPIVKKKKKKA
ncbi:MAG: hypothetical protein KJ732_00410, partial [Candidatus Margulisbacteria bacterium]|nr:hypothetical protein [Candidatus Margulisiibacteriota bacterium]